MNHSPLDIVEVPIRPYIPNLLTIEYLLLIILLFIYNNKNTSYYIGNLITLMFINISKISSLRSIPLIPYLTTIFIIIIAGNLLGLIPYFIALTSHIIITLLLSTNIIIGNTLYGLYKYRFSFINLFMPKGIPTILYTIILPTEIISYLSRILSLSFRLSGNIIIGHVLISVISSLGIYSPIILIMFQFLEVVVALIQSGIWLMLTTSYINEVR